MLSKTNNNYSMVPKSSRISRAEFPSHNQKATVVRGEYCTVRIYSPTHESKDIEPNSSKKRIKEQTAKIAVVISKKTIKKAHERHVIKRRIVAIFWEILHSHSKKDQGNTYVIYPHKEIFKKKFSQIKKELNSLIPTK